MTGTPVELIIDPEGIRAADPADLWVTFPERAATTTTDIVGSFCCHVHFVAGESAAERWRGHHSAGMLLDLDDAHALGLRATAGLR